MIKNMIFDVGNVLVKFRPKEVMEELGFAPGRVQELLKATVQGALWKELDRGVIPEEEVIAQMRSRVAEDARADFDRFMTEGKELLVLTYSYAADWLRECKEQGYHVYLLSNYPVSYFELHSSVFSFLPYIDGKIVSGYVKMLKPDPGIYHCLLDTYHLRAEECLFFDDLPGNVEAAKSMGMHGICFTGYEEARRLAAEIAEAEIPL